MSDELTDEMDASPNKLCALERLDADDRLRRVYGHVPGRGNGKRSVTFEELFPTRMDRPSAHTPTREQWDEQQAWAEWWKRDRMKAWRLVGYGHDLTHDERESLLVGARRQIR